MARLGFRSVNEMVGRTECLRQRQVPDHPKAQHARISRHCSSTRPKDDSTMVRHATRFRNDGPEDRTRSTALFCRMHRMPSATAGRSLSLYKIV